MKTKNGASQGRNLTIEHYLVSLNLTNISSLASRLQQERSAFNKDEVAKVWIEAVLIELNKQSALKLVTK